MKPTACTLVALVVFGCSSDPGAPTTSSDDAGDLAATHDLANRPDAPVTADAATPDASASDIGALVSPGWHDRAALPAPQQEVAVVPLDGLIYVMGGFSDTARQLATVIVYDPRTDGWSARADFPTPAHHMNASVVDGKIWVTGFVHQGFTPDGRTFVYDPTDDSWTPGADLPQGRGRGASAIGVIDNQIYVAGGLGPGGAQPWVDVLDPSTGVWTALPDAPRAFDHAGYGVVGGKLVVAAGRNGSIPSYVDGVHILDPATGVWSDGAPIPTARGGVASAVHGGKLYVFGGEGDPDSPGRVFPQVEVYDVAADSWVELEPMPMPRHGFAGATLDDIIYLPGGAATEFLDAVATHQIFVP